MISCDRPSESMGGESNCTSGGLSGGQGTPRRRRNQQRASYHCRGQVASRQRQLLTTCIKLKDLGVNGKFQTTKHTTIMEQLQIRADRF